jgi:ribokinase
LLDGDGAADIAAPAVDLVDSTGAGDAFCGGLAAELAGGRYLRAAATAATYAGSFAVTAIGARGALPTREALLGLAECRS